MWIDSIFKFFKQMLYYTKLEPAKIIRTGAKNYYQCVRWVNIKKKIELMWTFSMLLDIFTLQGKLRHHRYVFE